MAAAVGLQTRRVACLFRFLASFEEGASCFARHRVLARTGPPPPAGMFHWVFRNFLTGAYSRRRLLNLVNRRLVLSATRHYRIDCRRGRDFDNLVREGLVDWRAY